MQKAEAQAREAQIEAALERVRSRTMGMQKSEELKEVIRVVYEQFVHLKINVDHAGFVVDYTPKGDWHFWIADEQDIPSKITHPYFESVWANQFNEAKEKGADFFATNLNFEEKNKFYNELLSYVPGLPEASKDFYLSCPGLAASTVLLENVCLYIENFSGIPYSDEENNTLMRFGKVFQQTYTRFLDLQKAEAQAREAQIESSLERVRAVAMAMHASDDLLSICEVTFKEFQKLGFENLRNALIHIPNDEEKFFMDYDFSELMGGAINKIKYGAHPIVDDYLEKIRSAKDAFAEVVINEDQLKGWKKFRKESGQYDDPRLDKATALYYYLHSIGIGDIGISTLKPIDENQIKILKRFRNVFDLAYRRYNDIALAEEQARETQIQLALERVRARTMAMHKSEELSETSLVLFNQLKDLGEVAEQISIGIFNVDEGVFELYATIYGSQWEETGRFPLTKHPVHKKTYEAWKEQKKSLIIDLTGEKLEDFNKFKMETSTQYKSEDELPKNRWVVHSAFFSKGVLTFSTHEPRPLKTLQLLERFANVFDLTYTRFLDLQKAEAQARESQIEASLERVRAKAMAMHSSSDLSDTMGVLFKELPKLGINSLRCGVVLLSKKSTQGIFYAAATTLESDSFTMIGAGDMKKHPVFTNQYECWLQKENYFLTLSGEELAAYYKEIFARVSKTYNPREHKLQSEHGYYFAFSEGMFYAWSEEAYSEESINILNRFKAIIDLTFRRYLDLQKAEAQAKEAKIEASLERVRSKAMSMHNSKDLAETLGVFYRELKSLSVTPRRCGVALMNKETRMAELTTMNTTEEGDSIEVVGQIKMAGHPVLDNVFENWLIQKEYQTVLRGNQIKEYYQILKPQISYPDYPHDVVQFGYYFMFNEGDVYAWTEKELTEDELKIYRRFTTVISLTYKRYIDLQQAEAQAREAEIEAALERVRSRTMAMQKSNELADTASHFFEQLNSLDIKSYRFNIAIVDAESEKCRLWSTTNEGKVIPAGPFVPLTEHNVLNQMYEGWKLRQNVLIIKLLGEERINWTNYIMNFVSFNEYKPENIDLEKLRTEPAIFSNFFFKQGFVVLHTIEEIDKSDLKIIRRFVNVFEQTYTRFLDLQKAEAQAREAKIEASLERVRSKAMSMHSSEDLSETVNIFFKELKALEIIPIRCGVGQIDAETRTTSLTTTTSSQQGDSFQVIGKVKQTGHPVLDGIFDHWKLQKEYHPVLEGKDIKVYYDVMNPQIGYPVYSEDVTQYGNNFYFKEGFVFAWTEHKLSEEELKIFRRFTSVIGLTYRRYLDLKEAEARAIESIRQASLDRIRAEIASMRTSEDLNRITPIVWRELKNLDVPFFRCGVYIINEAQEKVQVYLNNTGWQITWCIEFIIRLKPDYK